MSAAISKTTGITVGLVIALVAAIVTPLIWWGNWQKNDAVWKTNTDHAITQLQTQLNSIAGDTDEDWDRTQMRMWILETQRLNSNWTPALLEPSP